MLLIYTKRMTNRVGYTFNLVFRDVLALPFRLTTNPEEFESYDGPKLCYGDSPFADELFICAVPLLFETTIESQNIHVSQYEGLPMFFETLHQRSALPFDVFAAVFYLVSRYEEYLPFVRDPYGRFTHEGSLAYRSHFLDKPVVNRWAVLLERELRRRYPDTLSPANRKFSFVNTIDVDQVWLYKGKNIVRQIGGGLWDLLRGEFKDLYTRFTVLFLKDPDPYDTFDYVLRLHKKSNYKSIFFFLFAPYGWKDRNVSVLSPSFRNQVRECQDAASIGIHPSFASFEKLEQMTREITDLENVTHTPITKSRFHYLRMQLPISYRNLLDNEIEEDYSMGYAKELGFRSSVCSPHAFYDLEQDFETSLRVYPFCIMDAAMLYHMHKTPDQALQLVKQYIQTVYEVKGTFISIWHNETLSNRKHYKGWRNVYEAMIDYINTLLLK